MDFDQPNQTRIPWKPILIIGGSLVLAIVIIVSVLGLVRTRSSDVIQKKLSQLITNSENTEDACSKVPNPELCKTQALKDSAYAEKNSKTCDLLDGLQKDDCMWGVAKSATDPSVCALIKTSEWINLCSDGVLKDLAIVKNDLSVCDKILNNDVKSSCREEVSDPDFDGLDSKQELEVYKTDPNKSDTDGDGYKDGEEIKTGHDPLKKDK